MAIFDAAAFMLPFFQTKRRSVDWIGFSTGSQASVNGL
jgi:hypothetical protein